MRKYFWLGKYRDLQRKFYQTFPKIEKAHYLKVAQREYGFTPEFLEAKWDEAQEGFYPGKKGLFHLDATVGSDFFYLLAKHSMDNSVSYTCVLGNCVIMWDEGRDRFIAAMGAVGCPCNDERDLSTRRLS